MLEDQSKQVVACVCVCVLCVCAYACTLACTCLLWSTCTHMGKTMQQLTQHSIPSSEQSLVTHICSDANKEVSGIVASALQQVYVIH